METTIPCRRCGVRNLASEYNSPERPTCQVCLDERREAKARRTGRYVIVREIDPVAAELDAGFMRTPD
jgi:hypothetical protein